MATEKRGGAFVGKIVVIMLILILLTFVFHLPLWMIVIGIVLGILVGVGINYLATRNKEPDDDQSPRKKKSGGGFASLAWGFLAIAIALAIFLSVFKDGMKIWHSASTIETPATEAEQAPHGYKEHLIILERGRSRTFYPECGHIEWDIRGEGEYRVEYPSRSGGTEHVDYRYENGRVIQSPLPYNPPCGYEWLRFVGKSDSVTVLVKLTR